MDNQGGGAQAFVRRERGLDSFRRSMRRSARKAKPDHVLIAMLRGVLIGAAVTVLGIAIFAVILNWWNASDSAITAINQVVKFVSILAGVTSAMHAGASGGVIRGALVGLLYMALGIVCYCLLMGQAPRLSGYLADLGMGLAAGGLFAMILTAKRNG